MARLEILLKSTQKQSASLPHPLDSSFRWNDEDDTLVIPGKAAGRDPESSSPPLDSGFRRNDGQRCVPCFCLHAEHHVLWTTRTDTAYPVCRYVALSVTSFICLMLMPTLALAHGGMGPDEIGPPIMTSGLIGFVSYWAVMLWPSTKKNADQTVGASGQNLSTSQTGRRPKKRSARVKRMPRLRKIEGSGHFESDQHTRRKASDG